MLLPGGMDEHVAQSVDALTEKIIGCAIAVHKTVGPGLLESVYRDCLEIEMRAVNLRCERERRVSLKYRGEIVAAGLKVDLVVEGRVVIEVKTVERIHPVHLAQVITYLKLTDCPAGLLLNFNATSLRGGLKRLQHPDVYAPRAIVVTASE